MNQKINLKEIAKKAYTSYHQDGILDITISLVIIAFGIMMVLDLPWLGGTFGIVAMSFYAAAKKLLTVPRIGYVKFPTQRAQRINVALLGLGVLSLLFAGLAFVQTGEGTPAWLQLLIDNYMITVGLIISGLFVLAGYTCRTKRMYTYALASITIFGVGHFIYFPLQYYLTLLGTLVLIIGLAMLIRFVSKYPKAAETMDA
jgi:predicted small integral membrane protein